MAGFRPAAVVLAAALALVPAASASRDVGSLAGKPLLDALRGGGYVVYFRHAATDFSMADTDTGTLANCAAQRNLDARGRADARAIGTAWRALRLPVGQVLASRYCRDPRHGAARLRPVQREHRHHRAAVGRERRRAATQDRGAPPPALGASRPRQHRARRAPVQHPGGANISLEEGEAAVFAPRGRSGFRLVGRVLPRAWARLAPLAAPALTVREYDVPAGTHPHDVAPASDGGVWYTAQATGALGRLDPATGRTRHVPLGAARRRTA